MEAKTNEEIKSKTEMLKEMQNISEDIEKYKEETEVIMNKCQKEVNAILEVIDQLELKYYELAHKIQTN